MALTNLTKNGVTNFICEMINRIINATVGDKVRRYRRQNFWDWIMLHSG